MKAGKISKFIENARLLDYENDEDVNKAIDFISRLHRSVNNLMN